MPARPAPAPPSPDVSTNSRNAGWRLTQHLLRRAADDDLALVEHRDAVADAEGRRHVVGDHDRGHPEIVRGAPYHLVDVLGRDRIEARRRLVVEQDLRTVDQGARQADALALPARKLGRNLLFDPGDVGEVQPSQQIAHPFHDLVAREPVALDQREGDVLDDVHRIEQRRVLEHHAELAAQLAHLCVGERHDVLAVDPDLAAVRPQQPHQVLHQHRLPLPRTADDDVRATALDVEVDAPQDVLGTEGLVQPAHPDLPALVPLSERIRARHCCGGRRARIRRRSGRLVHGRGGHNM